MRDTIDMAREAGLHIPYWGEEEDPKKDPPRWTMASPLPPLLKAFEALVRADEREAIKDEWWMCVQSDLEHGVKSLNENAAKDFNKNYPEIAKFGAWLEARGNT